jgi:chromosome segregation ATPase
MKILHLLFLGVVLTAAAGAADPVDPSVKLRTQLREVMLQLRAAQTESANAQAAATVAETKSKELADKTVSLEKRIESLTKEANAAKVASDESIAGLNQKLADREKRVVEFQETLEKWKSGYQNAATIARSKEGERAVLASEVVVLKRTVADRETKNISLFNTANEILDRYEGYALGKALGAREPFIGTTRVKIENQVQGYKDRIVDNRIAAPAAKQ